MNKTNLLTTLLLATTININSNWLRDQISQIEPALQTRAALKAQINWGRKLEGPTVDQIPSKPTDLLDQSFCQSSRSRLVSIPLDQFIQGYALQYFAHKDLELISKASQSHQNNLSEQDHLRAILTAILLKEIHANLKHRYIHGRPNWHYLSPDELNQIDQLARQELKLQTNSSLEL